VTKNLTVLVSQTLDSKKGSDTQAQNVEEISGLVALELFD
jgi:hypothetical protein